MACFAIGRLKFGWLEEAGRFNRWIPFPMIHDRRPANAVWE
jgi:hypothetical protein